MKSLIFAALMAVGFVSQAQEATNVAPTTPASSVKKVKKSTDVNFEDVLVQGKYYFSDESVATVEQDKVTDALLKVRKDFRDRVKKSSAKY